MDISLHAATAEDIDALTEFQIANFFHRHNSVTKDDCNNTAANIIKARATYGEFVPNREFRGMFSDLYVYEMDLVAGAAFCRVRQQILAPGRERRLLQTVKDFASFFASAWTNKSGPAHSPDMACALFSHYSNIVDQLSQSLPERFRLKLDEK
ncbi:hypothetical protein G6O67_007840 [Ophiocordyceps sinensis]|uniref:Uncharacterized protein n=1 Tax=Ophiocordyceps sinensis TaxID=72228 RepID=A0A8H4PLN2_9HYPO|nr:hypothetical protein G6O67_007840 [Ophiocordyceps sinensis]